MQSGIYSFLTCTSQLDELHVVSQKPSHCSTSLKYSNVSASSGVRHVLVCDVALGKTHSTRRHQPKWTDPPPGFDSVHAVRNTEDDPSQFEVTSAAQT